MLRTQTLAGEPIMELADFREQELVELTALENVLLKNRLNDYKKKKEIIALFEAIGIPDKINEKAGMLSFGQQQRLYLQHIL